MIDDILYYLSSPYVSYFAYRDCHEVLGYYDTLLEHASELEEEQVYTMSALLMDHIKYWDGESAVVISGYLEKLFALDARFPELEMNNFIEIILMQSELNKAVNPKHTEMLKDMDLNTGPVIILACSKDGMVVISDESPGNENLNCLIIKYIEIAHWEHAKSVSREIYESIRNG